MNHYYWEKAKYGQGIGLVILMLESSNQAFEDQSCGRVYKVHAQELWKAEEFRKVPAGDRRETTHDSQEEAMAYLLAVTRMT